MRLEPPLSPFLFISPLYIGACTNALQQSHSSIHTPDGENEYPHTLTSFSYTAGGRAILTVPGEFEVSLTLWGATMDDPWRLLTLKFLFRPADDSKEAEEVRERVCVCACVCVCV